METRKLEQIMCLSTFGLIKMYGKALLKNGFHGKRYNTLIFIIIYECGDIALKG